MHIKAIIAGRMFFTMIMGYEGVVELSEVYKGISKVPIMAPQNALLARTHITHYIAYQCVV